MKENDKEMKMEKKHHLNENTGKVNGASKLTPQSKCEFEYIEHECTVMALHISEYLYLH